jgi:LuxR family transcriptional regulator, maltose regulon positive regulatory protein
MPTAARPFLAAKLAVPPPRAGAVVRGRLLDQLEQVDGVRLVTVVAPAGWGKTTLLAEWASSARHVGWVSLDEADDEPIRFWTYALTALSKVAPEETSEALAALNGQGLDPVGVALATLLNAFQGTDKPSVLVLDDYHVIGDVRIHEAVMFLLTYLPSSLRLVLAGRADPPLPLARLRASGQLLEIRLADLRCTTDEGIALLASSGVRNDAVGQALVDRTEGWPAALHLAALAIRDARDPAAAAAAISTGDRHILDYISLEVLPALDVQARELLLRCSALERLSGPLCDAVLETEGSAVVLDRLDRADLFVRALDDGRTWYRCHRLFREVLQHRLDAEHPNAASESLIRASQWYLDAGQVEEAVSYRAASGDREGALELLRSNTRWFLEHGGMAALLRLGDRLADGAAVDPRFCLSLAFAAGLSGMPDRARHWLTVAEPLADGDPAALNGWRTLRAALDVTWAAYASDTDEEAALAYARRAVELEDDPTVFGWVVARQALAGLLLDSDDVAEAVALLETTRDAPALSQLPALLNLQAAGQLALGCVELGELERAATVVASVRPLARATEQAWGPGAAAAVAALRLAEGRIVALTEGNRAALELLGDATRMADGWGRPVPIVGALTSLAAAEWACGEAGAARAHLDRAEEVARGLPATSLVARRLTELTARIGRRAGRAAHHDGALAEELSSRELAVLRALRGPLSAREVGAELHLSVNTVKTHTKSLYRKLNVSSREEAVVKAHELGLI